MSGENISCANESSNQGGVSSRKQQQKGNEKTFEGQCLGSTEISPRKLINNLNSGSWWLLSF